MNKITHETTAELLGGYKPKTAYELAEWFMMAARNLKDADGKIIYFRLDPAHAYQIACMMQAAKLKVPK
jgi:hypothetical protein